MDQLLSPSSGRPLIEVSLGRYSIFSCGDTGGAWIDNESAAILASTPMKRSELDTLQQAEESAAAMRNRSDYRAPATPAERLCPVCGEVLAKHLWKLDAGDHDAFGIELDVCPSHGTWFDRGEIARMVLLKQQRYEARSSISARELSEFKNDLQPDTEDVNGRRSSAPLLRWMYEFFHGK